MGKMTRKEFLDGIREAMSNPIMTDKASIRDRLIKAASQQPKRQIPGSEELTQLVPQAKPNMKVANASINQTAQ
jgi:hypothetical protein